MSSKITKGLYDPAFEHDSCGIGFVASLANQKSHDIVENALKMLSVMEHRGGCGCDVNSGDGAGILIQKPHKFLVREAKKLGIDLPSYDEYGVGQVYLPQDNKLAEEAKQLILDTATKLGLKILGYRKVFTDNSTLGEAPLGTEPSIQQVFVQAVSKMDNLAFERKLYVLRNYTSYQFNLKHPELNGDFYYATFSSKTVGYKGQLNTAQVRKYFLDLHDEDVESTLALVHSRFSTNTFPKWKLAQPFRYIAHNGEINTVRGNVNWMTSREAGLSSDYFTDEELQMLLPICDHTNSDSANLDNVIELLALSGRSLPHVMMMLVPEAWQEHKEMEDYKKDFYRYHAQLMEPWDGPASICFTDGKMVGATLDRNGLRPSRYTLLDDGILIMASEAGVIEVDPSKVVKRGRLQPGKIFVADLEQGKIIGDDELKKAIAQQAPYGEWIKNEVNITELSSKESEFKAFEEDTLLNRQQAFGYSSEDLKVVIAGLSEKATEPLGSMGIDAALPILSDQSQHLSNYFKQLFAQVTNPPIDPIREKMVMSLYSYIGRSRNVLRESAEHCRKIRLDTPVLTNDQFNALKYIDKDGYKAEVIDIVFDASDEEGVLEKAVEEVCQKAIQAVQGDKVNILILSDRKISSKLAPIPSLLVT
jgi:glutamate synthase (NADPH) large chain